MVQVGDDKVAPGAANVDADVSASPVEAYVSRSVLVAAGKIGCVRGSKGHDARKRDAQECRKVLFISKAPLRIVCVSGPKRSPSRWQATAMQLSLPPEERQMLQTRGSSAHAAAIPACKQSVLAWGEGRTGWKRTRANSEQLWHLGHTYAHAAGHGVNAAIGGRNLECVRKSAKRFPI